MVTLFYKSPFISKVFDPPDVLHSLKYTKMNLTQFSNIFSLSLTSKNLPTVHWENQDSVLCLYSLLL